jgi:hypothetical protein
MFSRDFGTVQKNDAEAKKIAENGFNFCELVFSSDFQKKYLQKKLSE